MQPIDPKLAIGQYIVHHPQQVIYLMAFINILAPVDLCVDFNSFYRFISSPQQIQMVR